MGIVGRQVGQDIVERPLQAAEREGDHPLTGGREQWGAWEQGGGAFLYAVQTAAQLPRLELWTAAGRVTLLGGALAPF